MGYDERQQPNSSGALVAVIGVGLVLAILAIIAVAAVGLFWVRGVSVQSPVAVAQDREGNLSVAGDVIGLDELKKRLAEFKDKSRNTFLLRIETEPECPVKHVVAVVAVCDEVGDIDYRVVASKEPDVSAGESKTDE